MVHFVDFESQRRRLIIRPKAKRGNNMPEFGISWDTFGGSEEYARRAAETGLSIEVLARRRTEPCDLLDDLAKEGKLRIHGPWWSKVGRWHFYAKNPLKTLIFDVMLGSWEANPAAALAVRYGAPLVVHHGILKEIMSEGKGNLAISLYYSSRVEVENDNYETFPWPGVSKFSSHVDCVDTIFEARKAGCKYSHVLDIGHLAQTNWNPRKEPFFVLLNRVLECMEIGGLKVSSAHLSDYDPEGRREHLFLREGVLDVATCAQILVRHNPDINLILEAPSVSYLGSIKRRNNPEPWYRRAMDDIIWLKDQLALSP